MEEPKTYTYTLTYKTKTQAWFSIQVNLQLLKTSRKHGAQKDPIRGLYKTEQVHFIGEGGGGVSFFF